MTWADMRIKYPEGRENMAVGREQEFIDDCFSCYEAEGFAKKFWIPFEEYKDRVGQDFDVLKRCSAEDQDLKRNQRGEKTNAQKQQNGTGEKENVLGSREGSEWEDHTGQGSLQPDRHQDGQVLYDKADEG